MEDKEISNIYAIPATTPIPASCWGAWWNPGNAVETVFLLLLVGAPELLWIPMGGMVRVVVMTVTLLPLGVVAAMGVDGGSLFQYLGHILGFWAHRRKLHLGGLAMARKQKRGKGETTQSYLPIWDIRNGIVETTDGRYLKILEIEPINFALRSDEEQYNIISSFASWLKISPVRLQLKAITRRADSDKHVALVKQELSQEENPQCRAMGEDYLRLIQDVGSREALTRRFFLIFQYEAAGRDDGDYSKIYGALQGAEQTARAYFLQCGNGIVQPANPDEATAEILYQIFNRRSCQTEPFQTRVDRVVLDAMLSQGLTVGLDPGAGDPCHGIPGAQGN